MNGKMVTLSQDVFRMLNNCSLDITKTEKVEECVENLHKFCEDQFEDDGVTPIDFECAMPHFGAIPGKNDFSRARPDSL